MLPSRLLRRPRLPRPARRLTLSIVLGTAAAAPAPAQPGARSGPAPSPFAYDAAAPLAARDSLARRAPGFAEYRVRWASPRGGEATGVLLVPDSTVAAGRRAGRRAGVVVLHGAPGDAAGMGFAAEPLARAGAVVLTVDAPFARRDPGRPLAFTPQDSADLVQYVVDARRALDLLAARPDVDSARLAAFGLSYGGAVGAVLVAAEPRLTAAVLSVADDGLAAHYTAADGRPWPAPPGTAAAAWARWFAAMRPLAASRWLAPAARARPMPPTLYLWGTQDPFVRPDLARALWRAAPAPKAARWYASGHALPGAAGDDVQAWLARHVGTAAPPRLPGRAADYAGTFRGWGAMRDPLELAVVVDAGGRLALRGPFVGPDDPAGRLRYVGGTADRAVFRLDDKRLTVVRAGGRAAELHVEAPADAPDGAPRVHLVLPRAGGPR